MATNDFAPAPPRGSWGRARARRFAVFALTFGLAGAMAAAPETNASGGINLLQRYPTTLTRADTAASRARPWQFTAADVFHLSRFNLDAADNLRIAAGACDVGIGHCADGVVWALVIPRAGGTLTSQPTPDGETISHVWLRFHPSQINVFFPPETVSAGDADGVFSRMRAIANHKFRSSFRAGENAVIPDPNDLVVDADAENGPRRFFIVDRKARAAAYVAAFEPQNFKPHPAITPALAQAAFDQLWDAFDTGYPMFILRPEVNWPRLRDEYRPKAVASKTSDEFAAVCAQMLQPLRDLHVWLTLAGTDVPIFDRPRAANCNPTAFKTILGSLNTEGRVQWAITDDKIGFVAIYGWDDDTIPDQFHNVLEKMHDTRGLILDVRANGGGNEHLAQQVAGRFVKKAFVYAYDQFRDGPAYTNLTKKTPRTVEPVGPWRYERPVILLIGQKCMSSSESFVGMMTGAPNVTTMGDHTCGSSGNPQIFDLPLELKVSVPRWIDYKPDGTPLDEHGFQPQVVFTPQPGAFSAKRDDLLTAALGRLRKSR